MQRATRVSVYRKCDGIEWRRGAIDDQLATMRANRRGRVAFFKFYR